ncbi:peptide/nickel transport system substrate-binding protein [Thermodesulfovibrio aggregans]|uniref:Peptide/nickel transport system substrate-binding protein n=1 Tax=Thermodesulfovibrio aggregans TaxID=86166 RepID=A0A0U9HQW2_9BACT|nr:ABC transporter substrate-binding protein [Thermodesulfovibrio aggregans]GAQ94106.1 peptide/nickel transport system substrate-binding protein [Thermodesulfovibrio aggregans]
MNFKRVLFSLFVLVFISCSSTSRTYEGIVIALDSEPKRINPLFLTDLNSHMVSNIIFKGLIRINEKGIAEPELAESWEIKNNGLEIVFHLKENIYWHDGEKFKAEDVVFTYELFNSPQVASPRRGVLGPVKEIKVINPLTLAVIYKEPYGSAIESWSIGILPSHIGKKVLEPSFDNEPIGTGAFRIEKWQKGQFIFLISFDKFYGRKPATGKIILKFIPDPTTRYLELKSGKIDVAELPSYMKTDELSSQFNRYKADSFRYTCLGFNLKKHPFIDEKFRKAVAYSIDKEELINSVLKEGKISLGPYPANTWYFNTDVKPYPYDIEKARDILKNMKINSLKFSISINGENKEIQRVAQFIQQNLKNIGIEIEIKLYDWQTLRHRIIEEKVFDAVILSRAYLWDPDIYDLWHSSKTEKGQWNFFSFKDEKVDILLEKGRKTLNFNERQKIYREVHRLLYEKQACIFLYENPLVFYANKKIEGIIPDPRGMLYGVERWKMKRAN